MKNQVLALFIFVCLLALPVIVGAAGERLTPQVTPQVTPLVTPTPTAQATVEATAEATAEVTPEATAETTAETTGVAVASLIGDATRGDAIFHHGLNDAPACSNCHNTAMTGKSPLGIGPGLKGIAERAGERVEGETAAEYIEDSIRNPSDYVVKGFDNIMYKDFALDYSDQDIADLVAYVMGL